MRRSNFNRVSFASVTLLTCLGGFLMGIGDVVSLAQTSKASDVHVRGLFQKYCFDCHGEGVAKGDFDLEKLMNSNESSDSQARWLKVWKIVRHEFMPPIGKPKPSESEHAELVNWMAESFLGANPKQPDPGRVTIRRLNRLEYDFTVQDLFETDLGAEPEYSSDIGATGPSMLRLRDRLPPDETAYGFDNIGDFLSMPPGLLDKYFQIAEYVANRVVILDGPKPREIRLQSSSLTNNVDPVSKRADQHAMLSVKDEGKYRLETYFTVGGWQEYGGAYDITIQAGRSNLLQQRIEVGGYETHRFTNELHLSAGMLDFKLSTQPKEADRGGKLQPLTLRPKLRLVGPLEPRYHEYPEGHRKLFFRGASPNSVIGRKRYAREILTRVASRAFRRPVEREVLDGLVQIALSEAQFERGISQALVAILTSPRFLFRLETQPRPDDPDRVHRLDEYALASRLSYLLWMSLPDTELTQLAARGELRKQLQAQARRMLSDPKAARFLEDFPGQWLRTRNVLMTPISTRGGAGKVDPLRASMKRETEMLFEHVIRNDLDMLELITARYSFLDKPLADFYGIFGVPTPGTHRVDIPREIPRGGLLSHASFLVGTSNPNRTSPVKRGLFVLENLLAIEPPPPPANVPALDDVDLGGGTKRTGRELLAAHRADKSCAACHAHFDPVGIALENFDVTGSWRDKEEGVPIEASEVSASGETLTGLEGARRFVVSRKSQFYRGVTEKFMTYALGRGLGPSDDPTIEAIAHKFESSGGRFSTLLGGVLESSAFQTRRGDDGTRLELTRSDIPQPPPPEKRRPPKRMPPPNVSNSSNTNRVEAPGQPPPLSSPKLTP